MNTIKSFKPFNHYAPFKPLSGVTVVEPFPKSFLVPFFRVLNRAKRLNAALAIERLERIQS